MMEGTTGNILTNPTFNGTTGWNSSGMSGTTTGNTYIYSYQSGTISQEADINQALAYTGQSGLSVIGFNYGLQYRFWCANKIGGYCEDPNGPKDILTTTFTVTNSTGTPIYSKYTDLAATSAAYDPNWQNYNGTYNLPSAVAATTLGKASMTITGMDAGYWGGYYGPQIANPYINVKYGWNPCADNPAYSTSCPGFSSVLESNNLVPNPNAYAYGGYSINNSFAINKALEYLGAGPNLQIHGFKWGYVANANGSYCALEIIWCFDWRDPWARTNVSITDNKGATLYSAERWYVNSYNTTSYQYIFPKSQQLSSLGNFNFTGQTNDQAYIGSMWSKALYTPDICMIDPTSSVLCPNYWSAIGVLTTTGTPTSTTLGTTDTTTTSPTTTTTTVSSNPTTNSSSTGSTTTTGDTSQPITSTATTSTTTITTTSTSGTATASTTVTPTANNPQPKVGEMTTAGSQPAASKSSSTVSTSQILSIVRSEQSRIGNLETSTASAAAEQAQQSGTKAANDAQTIATTQQTQSAANAQAIATSITPTGQSSTSSNVGLQASSNFSLNVLSPQQSTYGVNLLRGPDLYSLSNANQNVGNTSAAAVTNYVTRAEREEIRSFDQNSAFEQRQSLSVTNPLAAMMNPAPMPAPLPPAPTGPSVNAKVKDNDAAGGMTIAAIAKQPQGFELYMGGLQDRPFYAPKEIYRGQRVVDNARAQRMLSGASDRLHQEMMEQQYKLGN